MIGTILPSLKPTRIFIGSGEIRRFAKLRVAVATNKYSFPGSQRHGMTMSPAASDEDVSMAPLVTELPVAVHSCHGYSIKGRLFRSVQVDHVFGVFESLF